MGDTPLMSSVNMLISGVRGGDEQIWVELLTQNRKMNARSTHPLVLGRFTLDTRCVWDRGLRGGVLVIDRFFMSFYTLWTRCVGDLIPTTSHLMIANTLDMRCVSVFVTLDIGCVHSGEYTRHEVCPIGQIHST